MPEHKTEHISISAPGQNAQKSVRVWSDETGFGRGIGPLELPGGRFWNSVRIEVTGTQWSQIFYIQLYKNNTQLIFSQRLILAGGQSWIRDIEINDTCSLAVAGQIHIDGFPPAGGTLTFTGISQPAPPLLFESLTWEGEAMGRRLAEGLYFPASHLWDHVTLTAVGAPQRITGVELGLIADSRLMGYPDHYSARGLLNGSQKFTVNYEVHQKTTLIGVGCIWGAAAASGGAQITLKAYYKKGD